MIKRMRYQFILVTMACISFIFILILCVINISMTLSSRNQGYSLLCRIADMPLEKDKGFVVKNRKEMTGENENPPGTPSAASMPSAAFLFYMIQKTILLMFFIMRILILQRIPFAYWRPR